MSLLSPVCIALAVNADAARPHAVFYLCAYREDIHHRATLKGLTSICCRAMPAPKQPQVRPPPPASGSHPSSQHQAAAQTQPPAHPSSQHTPSGISNQSAHTSLAPKPPKGKAIKAGKAPANANYVSAQQPGVLENVYAAARKGQKEAMLVAMLLCKPCKDKVGSQYVWKHADWCVLTAA